MTVGPITAPIIPNVEECWAEVAGHRMRYLRAGSGPPILLIHGLMAYSFSWRFVFPALARIRTAFAPDLLGRGYSERPVGFDHGMTPTATYLWKFLDQVGVENVDIVGSSHGGALAVRMAAEHPERVRKLVLAAPVNPWSRHGLWITRILATQPAARFLLAVVPYLHASGNKFLARLFGDPAKIPPGTLEGYMAPLSQPNSWDYALSIMRDWRADLQQLASDYAAINDMPALLAWGDRDPAVHLYSAQEIMKRMPHAQLKIFPGVGHVPYEEAPEDFNRAVVDFLLS